MAKDFLVLHDSDDAGLRTRYQYDKLATDIRPTHFDLMFPFLIYLFLRFCALFRVFDFADNGLNLDLCQRAGEAVVEAELVIRSNISRFGILGQDLELCASQGL